MSWTLSLLYALATLLAIAGCARIAQRERRRTGQLHALVLEATRRLGRCDFGHTMEERGTDALAQIARAFDNAAASLRRQAQKTSALLDLDRALLRGVELVDVMGELLSAAATALQSRSVSIVLLDEAAPARARAFDFLAGEGCGAPRLVTIDTQQLRGTPSDRRELSVSAAGVDSEDFLAPLTRGGARAFRLCALECGNKLLGFLCVGYRVEAHDCECGEIGIGEIAERISLAMSARTLARAVPAAAAGLVRPVSAPRLPSETGLYRALRREEFTLQYQPIISAGTRRVAALEALVRWPQGADSAMRTAAEFVPIAEHSGLIVDLGDWVLRTACQQFDGWRRAGLELDYVAVNVSARQLLHAGLLPTVLACLRRNGMEGSQLQLEFNASTLDDSPPSQAALRELARLGVRLALDDFGAGGLSLGALYDLPLDTIKIDPACVAAMGEDAATHKLVRAAVDMAGATHRRVIAEGVERPEQLAQVEAAGCDAMQGFLFAAALDAADVPAFVRAAFEPARLVA